MKQPQEVENLLKQAGVLRDVGRTRESLPLLERALATAPFDADMLCHLSLAYLTLKEWGKSLAAADKALATNPISEWAHRLRSSSLRALGRREEALASAHNAARYKPDAPIVLYHLGETLRWCADYKAAEETGKRLLQVAPEEVRGHLLLTAVYTDIQQWAAVESHARMGLRINAEHAVLYRRLGKALIQQERNDDAVQAYLHSLQIEPTHKQTQAEFSEACLKISLSPFSYADIGVTLVLLFLFISSWKIGVSAALCATTIFTLFLMALPARLSPILLRLQPAYRRLPASTRRQVARQCHKNRENIDFALAVIIITSLLILAAALFIARL